MSLVRTTVIAGAIAVSALVGGVAIGLSTVMADGMPGETEPAACRAETVGSVSCMSGVLCECVMTRGGTITGEIAGYRWRCDNKRPLCGDTVGGPDVPATINPYNGPYPNSLSLDYGTVNVGQSNENSNSNTNSQ